MSSRVNSAAQATETSKRPSAANSTAISTQGLAPHQHRNACASRQPGRAPSPCVSCSPVGGNEMRYHSSVDDIRRQHEFLTASKSERFSQEFDLYQAIYEKLETKRRLNLTVRLLDIGRQVRNGTRTWVRHDLEDIASWKGLPPRMLMMDMNSSDFEGRLESALRIEDEPSRVSALCDIRGMGPVLASMVLMFTWPETCGFMDNHTCNALRYLGFNFPKKYSTSRFTVGQLLAYLRIVRMLREHKAVSSMEIAEALYALDSVSLSSHYM